MNALIKYEAACRALAECKSVDEVNELLGRAMFTLFMARAMDEKVMQIDAAEVVIRAERRIGQFLIGAAS